MADRPAANLERTLLAAAAGDEGAWRQLVGEYSIRVFALLRAQCSDADLAEEITQSTFCTIAAKLSDYTELGKFESWLFRIAMNRLRDEMRRRKRQALPVDDEALGILAGEAKSSSTDWVEERDLELLREAMTHLSEQDRQVIHLRHFGELSFRQIAELLGQPLGTVLARQHRALQKLADLIESSRPSRSEPRSGGECPGVRSGSKTRSEEEETQ
jgi:RNA polymerase sigma-70 factor (ECF subfamily)